MIRECKKAAWQELKENGIIPYSVVYFIFTAIFSEVTDTLQMPTSSAGNVIFTSLTNFISFSIYLGYMHMIMNLKPTPYGFFSFFAPKHLKFILLTLILLIIPSNIFTVLMNKFATSGRTTLELLSSTIALFFSFLVLILYILYDQTAYFKAIFPENGFFENIVQTVKFIFGHFFKLILFNLSFFKWLLAYALVTYLFSMKLDLEIVSTILQSIIMIFYSPYYVLSLKRFVNSCE